MLPNDTQTISLLKLVQMDWRPPCVTPLSDLPERQICKVQTAAPFGPRTVHAAAADYSRRLPLRHLPRHVLCGTPIPSPGLQPGFGLRPHPPGEPADSGIPCRRGQLRVPLSCGIERLRKGRRFGLRPPAAARAVGHAICSGMDGRSYLIVHI